VLGEVHDGPRERYGELPVHHGADRVAVDHALCRAAGHDGQGPVDDPAAGRHGGYVLQSDLGDPPTDWTRVRVIRDTTGRIPSGRCTTAPIATATRIRRPEPSKALMVSGSGGTTRTSGPPRSARLTSVRSTTSRRSPRSTRRRCGTARKARRSQWERPHGAHAQRQRGRRHDQQWGGAHGPTLTAQVVGATIASGATLSGPTVALVTNKARLIPIPLSGWAFLGIGYGLSTERRRTSRAPRSPLGPR